ncbi:hypothetical protein B0H65DRAFT_441349 [Neurospora tetraspora]|uniref:Uncharacterized protein n=1 Tax=Neurospora tetraspora TaxID=94610 RepID=A0AAE0MTE0_9PEZI|nr:hypothetical protein B0H65DRAFT_441349 [Neurospora tetraspora]
MPGGHHSISYGGVRNRLRIAPTVETVDVSGQPGRCEGSVIPHLVGPGSPSAPALFCFGSQLVIFRIYKSNLQDRRCSHEVTPASLAIHEEFQLARQHSSRDGLLRRLALWTVGRGWTHGKSEWYPSLCIYGVAVTEVKVANPLRRRASSVFRPHSTSGPLRVLRPPLASSPFHFHVVVGCATIGGTLCLAMAMILGLVILCRNDDETDVMTVNIAPSSQLSQSASLPS